MIETTQARVKFEMRVKHQTGEWVEPYECVWGEEGPGVGLRRGGARAQS